MVSKTFINMLLGGMIITGTLNTLVYKYQNTTTVDGVRYNHPYMQALAMFVGEALCILLYWFYGVTQESNPKKLPPSYLVMAVPAFFDLITSSLQHIALNFIPSSIYQMLRGGVIVVTAIFTKVFLKKTIQRYQWAGISITILGISIVGLSNFLFASSNTDEDEPSTAMKAISIGLVILSLFSQAACYVTEEGILDKYNIHTFMMVGGEGMWGLLYFSILMPILNFIPCSFPEGCVVGDRGSFMEMTDLFFYQCGQDAWLLMAVLLGILSIALFNLFGVSVTKYVSAVARTVVDAVRTIIIWAVGLLVTVYTSRKWENTSVSANLVELLGYVFLVLGNLIYKNMIKIPQLQNKTKILLNDDVSLQE